MSNSEAPLPYGWIQQIDPKSGHMFYVDTKANPPRSIWTHPFEDEVYLREHPDKRNIVRGSNSFGSDASLPLPPQAGPRRHSFSGREATPVDVPPPKHKQGLFEKLKAKAVNSMEQHNERKGQQLLWQQQQMQRMHSQPQSAGMQYAAPQYAYPQSSFYSGGLGSGYPGRRRGGMGGMALPMMGGLAGGLLLGDMIGNDFGGNGDWGGGGDFGGGGFDGGDFGGGGFGF